MRRLLALTALILLPGACGAPAAGQAADGPIEIRTRAVEITGGTLDRLKLRGAVVLSADHPAFGGFSGLVVAEGRMIAVTDQGWLLAAPLIDEADGLRPGTATFAALTDSENRRFDKQGGDAEGLAWIGAGLAISFERDHRIRIAMLHAHRDIRDRAFESLRSNSGLEALATLPDGRLLAIAEGSAARGFPMFLVGADGVVGRGALPSVGRHAVTGADLGPDGRLYVVLRSYTPLIGVSIRIHRYRLGPDGFPDPGSRKVLAAFEGSGGVDNMEGIALWTDDRGRTRLTLIADNNFNFLQRTLVMDFEVTD